MKKALLLTACGCLVLSVWGCAEQAQQVLVENHPPQLLSLTADRTIIGLGETATLTASATDPDGDTLTFSWLATAGEIQGTGSQVVWVAPNDWGTQFIRCEVSDGRDGADFRSLGIRVQGDTAPTITSLTLPQAGRQL